jgi:hypothetical protein
VAPRRSRRATERTGADGRGEGDGGTVEDKREARVAPACLQNHADDAASIAQARALGALAVVLGDRLPPAVESLRQELKEAIDARDSAAEGHAVCTWTGALVLREAADQTGGTEPARPLSWRNHTELVTSILRSLLPLSAICLSPRSIAATLRGLTVLRNLQDTGRADACASVRRYFHAHGEDIAGALAALDVKRVAEWHMQHYMGRIVLAPEEPEDGGAEEAEEGSENGNVQTGEDADDALEDRGEDPVEDEEAGSSSSSESSSTSSSSSSLPYSGEAE